LGFVAAADDLKHDLIHTGGDALEIDADSCDRKEWKQRISIEGQTAVRRVHHGRVAIIFVLQHIQVTLLLYQF
jgi:hypothetical protein